MYYHLFCKLLLKPDREKCFFPDIVHGDVPNFVHVNPTVPPSVDGLRGAL